MKTKKETKIKGFKAESIIAIMVYAIVLIMTICSTFIGYNFKMDTAKAETITDLSGTIWTFNNTISELIPNQYYYINFYWYNEEEDPAEKVDCTKLKMYVNSGQTQKILQYDTTSVYLWIAPNSSIPVGWWKEFEKTIYIEGGQDATNSTFIAWIQQNATQVNETIDYTPQIEISKTVRTNAFFEGFNTETNTTRDYTYLGDLSIFKVENANIANPSAEEGDYFSLWAKITLTNQALPLRRVFNGLIGEDGKGYIIIAIPENVISMNFYYAEHEEETLIVDSIQNSALNTAMRENYTELNNISNGYTKANYEFAYRTGYNAGMETDQTLLSVIWGTMQLPFNILFGTYNTTTQTYEGGLFNFTILGIDVRTFTLGLMSLAIVLGIIKIILGRR